jgi:hypothetical protein
MYKKEEDIASLYPHLIDRPKLRLFIYVGFYLIQYI